MGQAAFLDDLHRVLEHVLGFGWKAGDDIRAEHDIGAQRTHGFAKANGIVAQMAAFHAFQDHVVTRLQGQVQMRHQPFFIGNGVHQVVIRLDGIDG